MSDYTTIAEAPPIKSSLLSERRVDLLLKRQEGQRPRQFGAIDVENRAKLHASRNRRSVIILDKLLVLMRLHAAAEGCRIEAKILGEAGEGLIQVAAAIHAALLRVQYMTHLPELVLVGGALRRLAGAQRAITQLQQVAIHELDLAGRDIVFDDLRFSFHNVEGTGASEEIGIHRQRHRRIRAAEHVVSFGGDALGDRGLGSWRGKCRARLGRRESGGRPGGGHARRGQCGRCRAAAWRKRRAGTVSTGREQLKYEQGPEYQQGSAQRETPSYNIKWKQVVILRFTHLQK